PSEGVKMEIASGSFKDGSDDMTNGLRNAAEGVSEMADAPRQTSQAIQDMDDQLASSSSIVGRWWGPDRGPAPTTQSVDTSTRRYLRPHRVAFTTEDGPWTKYTSRCLTWRR